MAAYATIVKVSHDQLAKEALFENSVLFKSIGHLHITKTPSTSMLKR